MAKKYYAVKKGRKTGVFTTWDVCKKMIDGYSGATFKSFPTWDEAQAYVNSGVEDKPHEPSEIIAYVDGSFDAELNACSYGVVILQGGNELHFSERLAATPIRNILGEIRGAETAMRYCIDNGYKSIDIYYDYEGIEKWCTGDWQAKNTATKEYKAFYDGVKDKISANFYKVAGHSGDTYHDVADSLAKKALAPVGF